MPGSGGCSWSARSRRGIIGLMLEYPLRKLFASAPSAAAFLIVNGFLLLAFERLRRRPPRPGDGLGDSDARIAKLSWRQAIGVGTAQAAALVPGISRAGVTMGGGLLVGLSNEDAARYGFLLATPIIGAAALLKLPELFGSEGNGVRGPALVGAICAGITTYFAVKFLLKYFETNRLTPFGIYCIAAGLTCTLIFAILVRYAVARLLGPGLEPGQRERPQRHHERGNRVLHMVVRRAGRVAGEERGQRLGRLGQVDDPHHEEQDAQRDGRHDQCTILRH